MRVQGGTRGILAAIDAGKLDPLDAALDCPRRLRFSAADWRAVRRRGQRFRKAKLRERLAAAPGS